RTGLVLAVLAVGGAVIVGLLPVWTYGGNVNGVVHRTVVSGPLLLALATAMTVSAIRRLFRGSPSGQDLALAPMFLVPLLAGVIGFVLLLGRIVVSGLGSFSGSLLTTPWRQIPGTGDHDVGYLNNIEGTFLLIGLTLSFAILPGVGAGVFMSEYP